MNKKLTKTVMKMNYTFVELAQAYFPYSTPQSAAKQLKRWMNENSKLQNRLAELSYNPHRRLLTPLQYAAFIEFLGEPCSFDVE